MKAKGFRYGADNIYKDRNNHSKECPMCNATSKLTSIQLVIKWNLREQIRVLEVYKSGRISVVTYCNQCEYINTMALNSIRRLTGIQV